VAPEAATGPPAADQSSAPAPPVPAGCVANTTPATFASQFAAAQPGQTVCLASGNYGTFTGAAKSGNVTVQGADGATAIMSLDLSAASNVSVRHVTVTGGTVGGRSTNITVAGSSFTGLFLIETSTPNANIVLDGNQHVNLDAPDGGLPARVTVWSSGSPSGVTIENSLFKGGDADGVRPDGDDVQVIGNEFADIMDVGANHADPIQFYGAKRAVVKGNYFHNSGGNISAYIMQADGGEGNVIEDNVFAAVKGGPGGGHGVGYGITLNSDNGSIIEHNTFQQGTCDFSLPCGLIAIGNKSGDPVGRGTIIRDNIYGGVIGGTGTYIADHNLTTTQTKPTFVGPLSSYMGFHLAPGSAGLTSASDGGAVGIR
jgi:hypothetical protein